MLKGKTAIITGGSRGIGRGIARRFAESGAALMLVALHEEKLLELKRELEGQGAAVEILFGDIAVPEFSEQIAGKAIERFGAIDILVNCAGVITRTPMASLTIAEWHRTIDVNLHGAFYLSRAVLPTMCRQNGGKVINITSQMARIPHPSASPSYEVSKAGLTAFTRHLAFHYAKYNICVNAIAPGSIDTDMAKSMKLEAREKLKNAVPLQRLGQPEEVGELALFLASPGSDYITGATFDINGGSLMS
jgi:3-oxoacyl-[acyl-carrier protein] reductase